MKGAIAVPEYSVYNSPNTDSSPKSDDTIHVALAVYDPSGTYSQHAGVVMTSIFENTHSKVTVHILHDDTLTDDNRRKFIRTAEKYSQTVEFHDVTDYMKRIGKDIAEFLKNNFTIGALFRLTIQDIILFDKVIYLDCDIIVCLDIRELWEIDIKDYYVAAVPDTNSWRKSHYSSWRVRCFLNGCDSYSYVNSGVMLINLAEIRKKYADLFSTSIQWLREHLHNASCPDQDAYNSIFRNAIKLIDKRFNSMSGANLSEKIEGIIIHSNGGNRVWEMSGKPYQVLYWKTYIHSAWGESSNGEELIEAVSRYTKLNEERRLFSRNIRKIFDTVPETLSILKLILKNWYYRLKYKLTHR